MTYSLLNGHYDDVIVGSGNGDVDDDDNEHNEKDDSKKFANHLQGPGFNLTE